MIRLGILAVVVLLLPALAVGTAVFALLKSTNRIDGVARMLVSVVAAIVFLIAAFVPNPKLGLFLAPGLVLVGAIAFIVFSTVARGQLIRYRVGVALFVAVAVVGSIQVATVDGYRGALCSTLLGDHTTYAPSYSASGFDRLEPGMSLQEVESLAGKPLEEWAVPGDKGQSYWRWTNGRDGSHYYRYRVAAFRSGHLEEKLAFFSCDLD